MFASKTGDGFWVGSRNFHDGLNFAVEKVFSISGSGWLKNSEKNGTKKDPGIKQDKNREN